MIWQGCAPEDEKNHKKKQTGYECPYLSGKDKEELKEQ